MRFIVVSFLAAMLLSGCAAPTDEMKRLQAQNIRVKSDLALANDNITDLEKRNVKLTEQVSQLNRISGTFEREKAVRVDESSQLRQDVRGFLRTQLTALREFSKNEDFLDYRGGELIERSNSLGKSLSLIDTKNRMNATGTLYGVRAQFNQPVTMRLAVLRAVGDKWVVVWRTKKLEVKQPGLQQVDFPVPVFVQADDLVAYLFPKQVPVSCDKGTGGIVTVGKQLDAGQKLTQISAGSLQGWSCSIGVVGMLGD